MFVSIFNLFEIELLMKFLVQIKKKYFYKLEIDNCQIESHVFD